MDASITPKTLFLLRFRRIILDVLINVSIVELFSLTIILDFLLCLSRF